VRGFTPCWLLLQLAHGPAHGYDLLDRMTAAEDAPGTDPGFVYRTLRWFDEEGLVSSLWDVSGSGPPRRVYAITDLGWEYLHGWAAYLRRTQHQLLRFLVDYEALTGQGGENDEQTRSRSARPR